MIRCDWWFVVIAGSFSLRKRHSPLEFVLHRAQFVKLLRRGDAMCALQYAREKMAAFAKERAQLTLIAHTYSSLL